MSTSQTPYTPARELDQIGTHHVPTETKASFKTTELIVYVAAVVGVLIAALVTDTNGDGQGFGASSAWLYVTLLTIGYMISRGLAKSGSRHNG